MCGNYLPVSSSWYVSEKFWVSEPHRVSQEDLAKNTNITLCVLRFARSPHCYLWIKGLQCFKCSKASSLFTPLQKLLYYLLLESLVGQLLPNQTLGMKPNSHTSFQQLFYGQLPSCECAVSTDYRKPFFKCSICRSSFSAYRPEVEENECNHPFLQSQLKGPLANRTCFSSTAKSWKHMVPVLFQLGRKIA